jgi:polyisoprenoid-binding protein YceI
MRKLVSLVVFAALPVSVIAADSYTIDPLHTFPNFTIDHLGFSKIHGRFGKTEGKLMVDEAKHTGSVDIVIDASSVDTGFVKRDDHLRSPDFLNATEFPEITYKSTKVTISGDPSGGNATAMVEGNLTISGVTTPVTLDVKRMHCGINPMDPKKKQYRCGFDAVAKIKRSDFGVKFGIPAIGDEMNIELDAEAVRD